jgi:hypothetical protein
LRYSQTQPFRIDDDPFRLGLKQLVVDGDEGNREAFGEFRVAEATFGSLELASGT